MCAAFMLVYVAVGIPLIGTFTLEIKYILLYIGAALLMSTAFASIFTMLAMLNQNKAVVAVSCILFAFISLFAGQHMLPPAHPRCACAIEYIEVAAPRGRK